jgi:hypothetical protein
VGVGRSLCQRQRQRRQQQQQLLVLATEPNRIVSGDSTFPPSRGSLFAFRADDQNDSNFEKRKGEEPRLASPSPGVRACVCVCAT